MMRSLYSAISGLKNEQIAMDVIGNNIANVNTVGYKYSRTGFSTMLSQSMRGASAPDTADPSTYGGTDGIQIGLGSAIGSIDQIMTQGGSQSTGKNTDLMLQGEGFFMLQDSNGNVYLSRNGNFKTDGAGNLVDASTGFIVQGYENDGSDPWDTLANINLAIGRSDPEGGTNTLSSFEINSQGIIMGTFTDSDSTDGTTDPAYTVPLYQIAVATCNNPSGLTPVGNNYYQESPNSGEVKINVAGENGNRSISTGCLEMSNVNLSEQFTDMIVTQRGFQANSRVITVSDSMLQELVDLKRQ
ncbi:fagellar hook-basal body protein [Syntrophobotulus glycolicus DSM 8271]|uniref:Flagellar hook protein FlgE n=1 Tax=Syntrophobotulus glycolicus (strain DSM 8271 / FlGlyR) TaxID=645991 RepID=F0SZX2_SYNGF|nr:flagellar hook-basal body complex protein [Syntrophobotulus glycolicus]ADY54983.1 fagellar hook-basal body protein [Syntrophobotulus glycolicus DSM 8271]